MRKLKDS